MVNDYTYFKAIKLDLLGIPHKVFCTCDQDLNNELSRYYNSESWMPKVFEGMAKTLRNLISLGKEY